MRDGVLVVDIVLFDRLRVSGKRGKEQGLGREEEMWAMFFGVLCMC